MDGVVGDDPPLPRLESRGYELWCDSKEAIRFLSASMASGSIGGGVRPPAASRSWWRLVQSTPSSYTRDHECSLRPMPPGV